MAFPSDPRLPAILATMRWHARPERFVLAGIDVREHPVALRLLPMLTGRFFQVTLEPEVLTLVLPEDDWRSIEPAFTRPQVERPYRVISFEPDLPPDLTGFMAALSGALAAAGVPLLALCGFSKDHLLVREGDLDTALRAIEGLAMGGGLGGGQALP